MDKVIKRYLASEDNDLMLCHGRGIAYQADMTIKVPYDENYFNKCLSYEDQDIARKINASRLKLVAKYVAPFEPVLDVGIGSGEFIKKRRAATFGYDVNPVAVTWLREKDLYSERFENFRGVCFWDVIEHVEQPENYFQAMAPNSYLFTSMPIMQDLTEIRKSRHYRPGEHLYYFTKQGFIDWMAQYKFRLIEVHDEETKAGRDAILSFAFKKDLPGYHDTIAQYQKMHEHFYGASAWLYLDLIAKEVRALNPQRILDYGCGRSDLVAHFWNEGKRTIAKYDAAIPEHQTMPEGRFGLVICCDVMEHIRMEDVDRIFYEIGTKSQNVIFTISMKLARAKLPDGRNAHVTLLNDVEWMAWIKSIFGQATRIPTQWDHLLMVKTF